MILLIFDHFNISAYDRLKAFTCEYPIMIYGCYDVIINFVTLCGMCVVPACFFISGFLFFNGWETSEDYYGKLKRRVHTLLVPYLIWNSLWLFFLLIFNSDKDNVTFDIGMFQFLAQYWDVSQFPLFIAEGQGIIDGPIYTHLWYIKDLMILVVISPLLRWLMIIIPRIITITVILWLMHPSILHYSYQLNYLGFGGVFFFLSGAYVSLYGGDSYLMRYLLQKTAITFFLFVVSFVVYYVTKGFFTIYIERICIILGLMTIFSISHLLIKKGITINANISKASFMIYALHLSLIPLWRVFWVEILHPSTAELQIALWFIAVLSNAFFCILIDIITKKYVPKLNSYLTGDR